MIVKDLMNDLEKGDRTKEMIAKKDNVNSYPELNQLEQWRNLISQQQASAFWR